MKSLQDWAIEYYGLQLDKEQNTPRWRILQKQVKQMVIFLEQVIKNRDNKEKG